MIALGDPNPFSPNAYPTALELTLDPRSFEALNGLSRQRAEFLCELCLTESVDAIWGWEGEPIAGDIPATTLGELRHNTRKVSLADEPPPFFIGGIREWDQFSEWAEAESMDPEEARWSTYYGALAHFSESAGRHFIVTDDRRALAEAGRDGSWLKGRRFIPVSWALVLVTRVMKAHGEVIYEVPHPNHLVHTTAESIYDHLSRSMITSRARLFLAARRAGESNDDFHFTDRERFCVSLFEYAADLIRGCDRIAAADGRYERPGIVGEIIYDLRAIVACAAGMIDTLAVLAADLFELQPARPSEISLNRDRFRRRLKDARAERLASEAARLRPLLAFVWSLRNPILHRGGLAGHILHSNRGQLYRAEITEAQLTRLDALRGLRGESPEDWGIDPRHRSLRGSIDPWSLAHRLAIATIEAVDELSAAFADDRSVDPDLISTWTPEEMKMIQRFRWMSGLPERGPLTPETPRRNVRAAGCGSPDANPARSAGREAADA